MNTIGLCSDHAGFELKEFVKQLLEEQGLAYKDFGTYSAESCDYPDYAHPLARAVEAGEVYPGIAICGSGNGIAMTLNKHQGIRAALCWQEQIAVMPGRFISHVEARRTVHAFLTATYEGGRHQRRIEKIPL